MSTGYVHLKKQEWIYAKRSCLLRSGLFLYKLKIINNNREIPREFPLTSVNFIVKNGKKWTFGEFLQRPRLTCLKLYRDPHFYR